MSDERAADELRQTKRLLAEYNKNVQAIYSLREMLKHLDGLEGIRLNGMPRQGKIGNPTHDLVAKRWELEIRLKNTERIVQLVDKALSNLTDKERLVVERRYINGMPWKVIIKQIYYSRKRAWEIGQRGLKRVDEVLFRRKCNN